MKFEIGDKVTWESQAQGTTTQKQGTVVKVIPPEGGPGFSDYNGTHIPHYGGGLGRDHESYLIEVPAKGKGRPHLYWPRVSALRKVA